MQWHPSLAGEQAADQAGGLAAGLHFLHSRKIVHFDMVSQADTPAVGFRLLCVCCVASRASNP